GTVDGAGSKPGDVGKSGARQSHASLQSGPDPVADRQRPSARGKVFPQISHAGTRRRSATAGRSALAPGPGSGKARQERRGHQGTPDGDRFEAGPGEAEFEEGEGRLREA